VVVFLCVDAIACWRSALRHHLLGEPLWREDSPEAILCALAKGRNVSQKKHRTYWYWDARSKQGEAEGTNRPLASLG
jgi:hypothetical protein